MVCFIYFPEKNPAAVYNSLAKNNVIDSTTRPKAEKHTKTTSIKNTTIFF